MGRSTVSPAWACVAAALLVCPSAGNAAGSGTAGPITTDAEFFAALLSDGETLGAVQSSFRNGDVAGAKKRFAAHLRARTRPRWLVDPADKPSPAARPPRPSVADADRYARNELMGIGIWYDFGPDIRWDENPTPTGNKEWSFEVNRHRFWGKLGRAYWDTGDEKYARAFVSQLRDWVRDNPAPRLVKANYVGSRWRTLEAGIRMSETWPDAWCHFLSSPSFGDEDVLLMMKSILEHARYLHRHPSRGNILTHELRGLYTVGAIFPEFREAAAWRSQAIERLGAELDSQVYPDGAQFELTATYHRIALRNFVGPLTLARLNDYPVPAGYRSKLEKMFTYAMLAAMPNGFLPGLNDANDTDMRESLREGNRLFPERADFLWVATGGERGTPPAGTSHAFPYAGQFVMRSGWEADSRYLLFDAGPFGHAHQHEDKLNFVIYAYGTRLLVDPGNYTYDRSRWRQYVTSSYAHNVIHVDGKEQHRRGLSRGLAESRYVVQTPLPAAWQTTPEADYAAASFGTLPEEGYGAFRDKSVVHTRQILFVKDGGRRTVSPGSADYWLVVDVLRPADARRHTYESYFHLDVVDVVADPQTKRAVSINPDRANIAIVPFAENISAVAVVKGREQPPVQGWHPTRRNGVDSVRPIPTVVFTSVAAGETRLLYALQPVRKGERPTIARVTPVSTAADTTRVRVFHEDGRIDELQVGQQPGVVHVPAR